MEASVIPIFYETTDFSYGQTLLYYKENMDEIKKKNKNIIFEQDRASTHTSKANKKLLNTLFEENEWMSYGEF